MWVLADRSVPAPRLFLGDLPSAFLLRGEQSPGGLPFADIAVELVFGPPFELAKLLGVAFGQVGRVLFPRLRKAVEPCGALLFLTGKQGLPLAVTLRLELGGGFRIEALADGLDESGEAGALRQISLPPGALGGLQGVRVGEFLRHSRGR